MSLFELGSVLASATLETAGRKGQRMKWTSSMEIERIAAIFRDLRLGESSAACNRDLQANLITLQG